MNKLHLPLVLAILAGCSAPDAGFMGGGPDPMAVRGVHDAVDGIDVWTDSVPTQDFEVVEDNVALTAMDPSAPLFPAQRIQAAADRAREANADAAIISSEYTTDATSPTGYNYEVDIIRYTE